MAAKKENITTKRKRILANLSQKALKLNNEAEARINEYERQGYYIENKDYIAQERARILKILSKSKPTQNDVDLMREYSHVSEYDNIRIGGQKYGDIRLGRITPNKQKDLALRINQATSKAESLYAGGLTDYANMIEPILISLEGDDYIPEAGDETKFFKIADDYTGNRGDLFKYIEFKQLPDTEEFNESTEAIENLNWSSQENYDQWMSGVNKKRLGTIMGIDITENQDYIINSLFEILSSSTAWYICIRATEDSDQRKQYMKDLFNAGEEIISTGDNRKIDQFKTMIENGEDLFVILGQVDEWLMEDYERR